MTNTWHIQLPAKTSDKVWNDTLSRTPDSPRCAAVAEFRLITGHDCLPHHLHRFGIAPSPIWPLCDLQVVLDKNHLLHWPALLTKTLISRYWEATSKINNTSNFSLSKFNLPLIGTFMWPTPPGPYRATTCRGRELICGWHTYFFDHTRTWRASPDEWSAQCRGHLRDSTNMKDYTHQAHTQSSQQGEYGMMITTAKWYSGTLGAKSFLTFVWQTRKNPKKNLTQETCPDRGSNPGPLHDKRACYHLLHSGRRIFCMKMHNCFILLFCERVLNSWSSYMSYQLWGH